MRRSLRRWILLAPVVLLAGACAPKRLPPVSTEPLPGGGRPVRPGPEPVAARLLGVGLAEDRAEVRIGATGPAELRDARSGALLARLPGDGEEVLCRRTGGGVAWRAGSRQGQAEAVRLEPANPDLRVTWGEEHYRGALLVIASPGGSGVTLVNDIDLEAYLRGVVPWEIGRHGQDALAALEAQAVAARTYTVSHLGARRERGFDVFADVMDQVYRGARDEDALCNEAVERTAGLVLRHGGAEIEAYYSSCCGGVTSQVEEVWARGERPYLVSHPDGPAGGDAWCAGSRHFHWRETWTAAELEAILARTLPEYVAWAGANGRGPWAGAPFSPRTAGADPSRPGALRDLSVLERTTSGRVAVLEIVTDAGSYRVRGDRVRWVLPPASGQPAILRSALFELELERDGDRLRNVAVRGRGYGHGIGLCQTGALAMARAGRTSREILAHYYPGAELVRTEGRP